MDVFRDELVHFRNMDERVEANSLVWELRFKWKCSLNEMYVLEYSALENKHFGGNLIKIGKTKNKNDIVHFI